MKWTSVARTDIGRARERNEDDLLVLQEKNVWAVADGMGGHANGNIASQMAVRILQSWYQDSKIPGEFGKEERLRMDEDLRKAIGLANREIYRRNQGAFSLQGMGTTVVVLVGLGRHVLIASVGDSRIYRFRDGLLEQLTCDHSLMAELVRHELMTEQDALFSPHRNIITRALGMGETVEPDTGIFEVESGDLFLLCSDGLTDMVLHDVMAGVFLDDRSELDSKAETLVQLANEHGGLDNITLILTRVTDCASDESH